MIEPSSPVNVELRTLSHPLIQTFFRAKLLRRRLSHTFQTESLMSICSKVLRCPILTNIEQTTNNFQLAVYDLLVCCLLRALPCPDRSMQSSLTERQQSRFWTVETRRAHQSLPVSWSQFR